jgi:hypothetical protein
MKRPPRRRSANARKIIVLAFLCTLISLFIASDHLLTNDEWCDRTRGSLHAECQIDDVSKSSVIQGGWPLGISWSHSIPEGYVNGEIKFGPDWKHLFIDWTIWVAIVTSVSLVAHKFTHIRRSK